MFRGVSMRINKMRVDKKIFCLIVSLFVTNKVFCDIAPKEKHISVSATSATSATSSIGEKESFVVKKSEKKCSKSKMQEDLCLSFAQQLSLCADSVEDIAKIQKNLLDQTGKYLQGSGECVFSSVDKNKLEEILRVANDYKKRIEDFLNDSEKYFKYLKSLKKI